MLRGRRTLGSRRASPNAVSGGAGGQLLGRHKARRCGGIRDIRPAACAASLPRPGGALVCAVFPAVALVDPAKFQGGSRGSLGLRRLGFTHGWNECGEAARARFADRRGIRRRGRWLRPPRRLVPRVVRGLTVGSEAK